MPDEIIDIIKEVNENAKEKEVVEESVPVIEVKPIRPKKNPICFKLENELKDRLQIYMTKHSLDRSKAIRNLLEKGLQESERLG